MLFPRKVRLLAELAAIGKRLTVIHLFEESPKNATGSYLGGENPEVEKIAHSNNTVWIDKKRTRGFTGVADEVWALHIGGYPVCEKWLKDRKGRPLSKGDVDHYLQLIGVLSETLHLMKQADLTIEKHGGWPGAFVTKACAS